MRPKWEIDLLVRHLAQEVTGQLTDDDDLLDQLDDVPLPGGRRSSAFSRPPRMH